MSEPSEAEIEASTTALKPFFSAADKDYGEHVDAARASLHAASRVREAKPEPSDEERARELVEYWCSCRFISVAMLALAFAEVRTEARAAARRAAMDEGASERT